MNYRIYFIALTALLLFLTVADILIGSVSIPLDVFLSTIKGESISRVNEIIIYQSRIPKVCAAILAGAALSVSGLLMQTLFRNPLAGPYILGISSGAGLGVAFLIMGSGLIGLGISSSFGISMAAVIGSISVLLILFVVSFRIKDVMTLLILGVMIGAIATAIIGLIQFFSSDFQLKSFLIWTLGSLSAVSYTELKWMTVFIMVSIILAFALSKDLNSLLMGEGYASSIGIDVNKARLLIILSAGILAGIITAFCGPIGFVGIVVPHLARLLFRTSNHQLLIPASFLIGACMLLISDILSNSIGGGLSLPINSITSLLGVPIIIWIIFNQRKISSGF